MKQVVDAPGYNHENKPSPAKNLLVILLSLEGTANYMANIIAARDGFGLHPNLFLPKRCTCEMRKYNFVRLSKKYYQAGQSYFLSNKTPQVGFYFSLFFDVILLSPVHFRVEGRKSLAV